MTSIAERPPPALRDPGATADAAETARLFEEYSEPILAFCLRRLGSRSEAEDAVQMTFLYALRALRRGVVPESESTWLYAIAKNVCRWQLRTLSRRGSPVSQDVDELAALERDHTEDDELCRDLKEALSALPVNQQRALVLREWHGLSSSQVADRMGMSAPATYALLTRARGSFVQAFTALRHPAHSVAWLVFVLRSHLKALLAGASTKAAVGAAGAVVAVGAGVGGVVAHSAVGEPATPESPASASVRPPALSATPERTAAASPATLPQADRTRGGKVRASTGRALPAGTTGATGPVVLLGPRRVPVETTAAPDPAGDPKVTSDSTPTPREEPTRAVPLDPLELPAADVPTDLIPGVELPELAPLLPVPEVEVPPVELPQVELPQVDLPQVDLPRVEVPPVTVPGLSG